MVETLPQPRQPRRQQIESAASALFRERGYAATSVRDIARALDIQGASLYAHVESKEQMLWSIVDGAAGRFERAAAEAEATGGGASDRLHALVRSHVGVVTEDPGAATVFVHEWRFLGPERRAEILARRDRYEHRFRMVIAEGIADQAFAEVDPAMATTFILGSLNSIGTWYSAEGRLGPDVIADQYADLTLRALGASIESTDATL